MSTSTTRPNNERGYYRDNSARSGTGSIDSLGHLHLAEQLYREALEAWEVHGGRPSTKAATFLNNLAHIIGEELGKVDEAEALYRRAIEMWTLDEGEGGLSPQASTTWQASSSTKVN